MADGWRFLRLAEEGVRAGTSFLPHSDPGDEGSPGLRRAFAFLIAFF